MKRTIRLNESELVRIVENTTRRMLTELDWKTYANAAKKAKARFDGGNRQNGKEEERALKFSREAADAFNRDYLQGNQDHTNSWWGNRSFSKNYEDEPYMPNSGGDHRGNHLVSVSVNPMKNLYGASLSGRTTSYNGNPTRYEDDHSYRWGPKDGMMKNHGYMNGNHLRDSEAYRDMKYRYERTPMFDKFNDVSDELSRYTNERYRYEKGRGWELSPSRRRYQ